MASIEDAIKDLEKVINQVNDFVLAVNNGEFLERIVEQMDLPSYEARMKNVIQRFYDAYPNPGAGASDGQGHKHKSANVHRSYKMLNDFSLKYLGNGKIEMLEMKDHQQSAEIVYDLVYSQGIHGGISSLSKPLGIRIFRDTFGNTMRELKGGIIPARDYFQVPKPTVIPKDEIDILFNELADSVDSISYSVVQSYFNVK